MAVDRNESISTIVDGGNAVHGVIRVDFCRGLFGLPAFLLLFRTEKTVVSNFMFSRVIIIFVFAVRYS